MCPCLRCVCAGGQAPQLLPPWSGERRARASEKAASRRRGAGRGGAAIRGPGAAPHHAGNLTDCGDGDAGANPGKRSGAARGEEAALGLETEKGATSFGGRLG